jgi:uncharacterized protein (DUF697 family)
LDFVISQMNQTTVLHVVERFETLLTRLPERIRKPILNELTPLKELFLKQRAPRFLFAGSSRMPMQQVIDGLFAPDVKQQANVTVMPVHRWTDWNIAGHGTVSLLDARRADDLANIQIEEELERQAADVIFFLDELGTRDHNLRNLIAALSANDRWPVRAKVVGISAGAENSSAQLKEALKTHPAIRDRVLEVVQFADEASAEPRSVMSILAEELPNEAKIAMIRISRDRKAQQHVAQMLVKSTTAICAAIGAQPIPLADMPVLTWLQVVMVSGIMYISGRERSVRAATEFIAALGANVGAAMLFREGARAILKFFPGWGNVVCGLVAGAGTYGIGRAATAFFIGGLSLREARQTYLASRKKRTRASLPGPNASKRGPRS